MAKLPVPKIHTEYDRPNDPGIDCSVMPSMCQQNFKEECDINNIVKRYLRDGDLDLISKLRDGYYADVSSSLDYHTANNIVSEANRAFSELPAHIRTKFDNDPGRFVEFCQNPDNQEQAYQLGLSVRPEGGDATLTRAEGGKGEPVVPPPPANSGAGASKAP